MKASSAIVVLFFIVIWAGNSLFEKPNLATMSLSKYNKKLDHFSVIVAQPGSKVFVQNQRPSDQYPSFSHTVSESGLYSFNSFGIRNDTLFVFANSSEEEHKNDSFYCNGVKSVIGEEKSEIKLWYFTADTLNLELYHAKLSGQFNQDIKKPRLLTLVADASKIDFKNFTSFNQMNLNLNRSHFNISQYSNDLILISGSMKNYSRLNFVGARAKGKVEKDETSYYNVDSFNTSTGTSTSLIQSPKF
jgi:hypothetical protein